MQYEMKKEFNIDKHNKIIQSTPIHKLSYKHIEDNNNEWLDRVYNLDFDKTKGIFDKFSI